MAPTPLQERRARRFANLTREITYHATNDDLLEIHKIVREVKLGEITLSDAHTRLKAIRQRQRFPGQLVA